MPVVVEFELFDVELRLLEDKFARCKIVNVELFWDDGPLLPPEFNDVVDDVDEFEADDDDEDEEFEDDEDGAELTPEWFVPFEYGSWLFISK